MKDLNWHEIGERLREVRNNRGVSQQQLGDALHITVTHISKIENGDRGPSLSLLIALSDYFGVSMDYLCGRVPMSKEEMAKSLDTIISVCQSMKTNL